MDPNTQNPMPPGQVPPAPMPSYPVPPQQPMPGVPQMPPIQPNPMPPAKKRLPKWLKIVIGVVAGIIVLVVAIVITTTMLTNAPKQVADSFMKDLQTNDPSAAYALTASEFQAETSKAELATLFKDISPELQGSLSVYGRQISKGSDGVGHAVLLYSISTSSGKKYVRLVLYDKPNGWQVVSFHASDTELQLDSD